MLDPFAGSGVDSEIKIKKMKDYKNYVQWITFM